MREIRVDRRQDIDYEAFTERGAREDDYDELVGTSFKLFEGDTMKALYIDHVDEDLDWLRKALVRIHYQENYRTGGMLTKSRTIGYLPRNTIRRDFCTSAGLANQQPEEHAAVTRAGEIVARYYREHNPDLYQEHKRQAEEKIEDGYDLQDTAFTSGIVNDTTPLKYHFDSGNFHDVWSGMLVIRIGVKGGHLALPEFNIGVECRDKSLFFFDGQGILHGVTPIKKLDPDARRFTVVYYSMRDMWNCDPLDDELARIRNLKTERERKRRNQE